MTTTTPPDPNEPSAIDRQLAEIPDDEVIIVKNDAGVVAELNRSELESQLDAAHKYPRSIKRFLRSAMTLATLTQDVAESCIYSLPRGGKPITGPSVRLAEICASSYGNLHVGARPMEVGRLDVISQGVAWDLETNYRVTIEAKRRITKSAGARFNEDMIQVTHAAATSIAFRNAIFRVIPRSYIDTIYQHVRRVAVGDAKTLEAKRAELFDRLGKLGVPQDRILAAIGKEAIEDVGLNEVEQLIGFGTAIKNNDRTIDDVFPPTMAEPPAASEPAAQGRRVTMRRPAKEAKPEEAKPEPAEDRGDDPLLDGTRGK
jgi:hypothetical protein